MHTHWFYSLRFRIVFAVFILIATLFGSGIYITHRLLGQFAEANTNAIIRQTSEILNLAISSKTTHAELAELNDYFNMLIQQEGQAITYLVLQDESGKKLVQTNGAPKPLPAPDDNIDLAIDKGEFSIKQAILLVDNQIGQLQFGFSLKQVAQARKSILFSNLTIMSCGLLLTMLGLILLSRGFAKQFRSLITASQALASGNDAVRADDQGKNELCYLAHNFNLMANAVAKRTAELQSSQQTLNAIFSGAQDGILLADLKTKSFIDANPAICDMLGYSKQELLSTSLNDICSLNYQGEVTYPFAHISVNNHPKALDIPILCKDGTLLDADINSAILELEGRYLLAGFFRNISERKALDKKLAQYREQLEDRVAARTEELNAANKLLEETQFAMDRVGIGIMKIDAETGHILSANDFILKITGFDRNELRAKKIDILDSGNFGQKFHSIVNTIREQGNLSITSEQRLKDKRIIPVAIKSYYHTSEDYLTVFVTDISEQKRAERAIIQAQRQAEAASQAKGAFIANMSHELRTPLNVIIGITNIAQRMTQEQSLLGQLDKIEHASKHLLQIINDILDLSKIEANRLVLEQIPLQLAPVAANIVTLLNSKTEEKGISLAVEIEPKIRDITYIGDPLRLEQILINLTSNAIKFTEKGSVTISIRPLENCPEYSRLIFEIKDTGIGMTPDEKKRLFTNFEQADNSMTRKYGGTGLGLSICKRLVGLMKGEIGCDSQPEVGSTFWFKIKINKLSDQANDSIFDIQKDLQQNAEKHLKTDYTGAKILLVEDDAINQEVALFYLEEVEFQIDVAEDGEQAYHKAQEKQYDLILMDMQMPKMNGIESTKLIRADSKNINTPIIAMTANAFSDDRQRCIEAGMNDHFAKPFQPDQLYQLILTWLEKTF